MCIKSGARCYSATYCCSQKMYNFWSNKKTNKEKNKNKNKKEKEKIKRERKKKKKMRIHFQSWWRKTSTLKRGGVEEWLCSDSEKRICNCRASLQNTDIIKIFTVWRVVYLGRFTEHCSTVWRLTVTHSTELWALIFLPRYRRLVSQNEGRSFHFSRVFSQWIQILSSDQLLLSAHKFPDSRSFEKRNKINPHFHSSQNKALVTVLP